MVWGLDPVLPGWRWLYEFQVAFFTLCGAVPTQGTTVFVPYSLELYMYGF